MFIITPTLTVCSEPSLKKHKIVSTNRDLVRGSVLVVPVTLQHWYEYPTSTPQLQNGQLKKIPKFGAKIPLVGKNVLDQPAVGEGALANTEPPLSFVCPNNKSVYFIQFDHPLTP